MKIIHISDLHILDIKTNWIKLINKRLLGGLNIVLSKKTGYQIDVVETLFKDINEQKPDHIVITGDFTNLSLPSEFKKVKELLEKLEDNNIISIIPGNHDFYIEESSSNKLFQQYLGKWLISDIKTKKDSKFPYVRLLDDNIAIIALNSSIPTCFICSAGKISDFQVKEFEKLMKIPSVKNRYKIILIHHHLEKKSKFREWMSGIRNRDEIVRLFSKYKIDLVLHGHRHRNSKYVINEYNHLLHIEEASASTRTVKKNPGSYSIYEIKNNKMINKKVRCLDFKTKVYKPFN